MAGVFVSKDSDNVPPNNKTDTAENNQQPRYNIDYGVFSIAVKTRVGNYVHTGVAESRY